MSDEEYDDSEVSEVDVTQWTGQAINGKEVLSRSGKNVGKTLRAVHLQDDDDGKQVVAKSRAFQESGQLSLGGREKVDRKRLLMHDSEEDEDDFDFDEELEEEDIEDEGPVIVKTSLVANPAHVRHQRKLEADILGVRIRMQSLVSIVSKISQDPKGKHDMTAVQSVIKLLLQMREQMFKQGSITGPSFSDIDNGGETDSDSLWNQIDSVNDVLWSRHRSVVEAWERRAHLTNSKGKALRAMNKGAFEQTDAALQRRAELGRNTDFIVEDAEFYQQLLRDFVQARSSDTARITKDKSKLKRQKYIERQKERAPKLSYEAHEKLINFVTPVEVEAPMMDVDQLVKSLFRS